MDADKKAARAAAARTRCIDQLRAFWDTHQRTPTHDELIEGGTADSRIGNPTTWDWTERAPRVLPSPGVLVRYFGSPRKAMLAAGIVITTRAQQALRDLRAVAPDDGLAKRVTHRRSVSDASIDQALQRCEHELRKLVLARSVLHRLRELPLGQRKGAIDATHIP